MEGFKSPLVLAPCDSIPPALIGIMNDETVGLAPTILPAFHGVWVFSVGDGKRMPFP